MVELERFDCFDSEEGADVTALVDISAKPLIDFCPDVPGERAFFLKESFVTFNCFEVFSENCCKFQLISQIPWLDHYAWAVFDSYNLTIDRGEVNRRQQGKYAFVSQSISLEMSEDIDFGYFQMICLPDQIMYEGSIYNKFDLMPFYVYRNRKVRGVMPPSPLITFAPQLDQSYVPMFLGQHLQLITADRDDVKVHDNGLKLLPNSGKTFTLGRNGRSDKLRAVTYVCDSRSTNLISVGGKSVILPPMETREGRVFIDILRPIGDAIIHTEGITGVRVFCSGKDRWAWDGCYMDVVEMGDGIEIHLLKSVNSLYLQCNSSIWCILVDKNMVGTI